MTRSFWWRLRWIVLGSLGLLSPWWWLKFPVCVWLGGASLWWLADRATDDRRLRWIILGSFGLRALLGIVLYAISYYHWPILRSLQIPGGMWTFGLDAHVYHSMGAQIVDVWRHGTELLKPETLIDYHAVVAVIYWLLGVHPLYPVLLNGWLGALAGWLAYRIGERLFDGRIALAGAILVSFWPSSLLWSSQLLKDTLSWWLVFMILWLVVLPAAPGPAPARVRLLRWALRAAGLVGSVVLLTRLRGYAGSALTVAALVTLVPACCASFVRGRVGRAGRLAGVAVLTIVVVMGAKSLSIARLISPAHPETRQFADQVEARLGVEAPATQAEAPPQLAGSTATLSVPPVSPAPSSTPNAPSAVISQAELLEAAVLVVDPLPLLTSGQPHLTHAWSGWASWQAGKRAEAEAEFWQAIRARPWSVVGYAALGALLIEQERLREALEIYASWPGAKEDPVLDALTDQLLAAVGEETLVRWAEPKVEPTPAVSSKPTQLRDRGLAMIREMAPAWLGALRGSVIASGGDTLVDTNVNISQPLNLVMYVPRALQIGLFAPCPPQWFNTAASMGGLLGFAVAEAALVYLLLAGVILRAGRTIRLFGLIGCARRTIQRTQLGVCFILVFGVILGAATGLVVANLGTLFRLRLLYWLPLLILVAAGQCSSAWYRRQLVRWRDRWRGKPRVAGVTPAPEPPAEASLVTAVASGEQG